MLPYCACGLVLFLLSPHQPAQHPQLVTCLPSICQPTVSQPRSTSTYLLPLPPGTSLRKHQLPTCADLWMTYRHPYLVVLSWPLPVLPEPELNEHVRLYHQVCDTLCNFCASDDLKYLCSTDRLFCVLRQNILY